MELLALGGEIKQVLFNLLFGAEKSKNTICSNQKNDEGLARNSVPGHFFIVKRNTK